MHSGGIAVGILSPDFTSHRVQRIFPKDLDIIDTCSLENSLAVAALGKDGTILVFRDILKDRKPHLTKFKTIHGTAYRILHSRGHLFVLTSKGFYVLANLASSILAGAISENLFADPTRRTNVASSCGPPWRLSPPCKTIPPSWSS